MNIGQASKHSGISAKMIRYYEEIGLLEAAQRSASGYRIYSETDLKTLNFLKHARELGFSSEQMKELISLWKNTDRHSAEVKALTVKHIAELKQKLLIYKKWLIFCRLLPMIAVVTSRLRVRF